jgi:hypothetical protein
MAMPFKSIRQTSCDVYQHVTTASHFTMTPRVVIFSSKLPEAPAASPSSARLCTSVAASSTRGLRSPQPSPRGGFLFNNYSTITPGGGDRFPRSRVPSLHRRWHLNFTICGSGVVCGSTSSHSQVLSRIRPGAAARQLTVAVLPWVCHVQMATPVESQTR